MGDKLDKEKRSKFEELEAPDFRRNPSTDLIRQRAAEKERSREARQNAKPAAIKRMQFTFSVDQPTPATPGVAVSKPDLKPSAEFEDLSTRRGRQATRAQVTGNEGNRIDSDTSVGFRKRKSPSTSDDQQSLRLPSLFFNDFCPSTALRPTIELPLDELLSNVDLTEDHMTTALFHGQHDATPTSDSDVLIQETSQSGSSRSESQSSRSNIRLPTSSV